MAKPKKSKPKTSTAVKQVIELNLIDAHFFLVLAVRYALGRRTFIVSWTCEQVRAIAPKLAPNQRRFLIEDIAGCENYGDSCNKEEWLSLLKWLKSLPAA